MFSGIRRRTQVGRQEVCPDGAERHNGSFGAAPLALPSPRIDPVAVDLPGPVGLR